MAQFVETSQGFINLDFVKKVNITLQGSYDGPFAQVTFADEEADPKADSPAFLLTGEEADAFIAHLRTVASQVVASI